MDAILIVLVMMVLLALQGFFSGSEIALVNVDKITMHAKASQGVLLTGLEHLENEHLEEPAVVVDGNAPLLFHVPDVVRVAAAGPGVGGSGRIVGAGCHAGPCLQEEREDRKECFVAFGL